MHNKKGFTFIEVAVVVALIAIISLIAFPSYRNSRLITQNEMARAKLSELATAARMYNEDVRGGERIAGGLGDSSLTGFKDPRSVLFSSNPNSGISQEAFDFNRQNWDTDGGVYHFAGYKYYLCNPDGGSSQPANSGCDNDRIATMKGPETGAAASMYSGHTWWVSRTGNLGIIGSDFTGE
ncbi:MAG: prepilin-type N-terminal cleavage/methylation domain-containing protein [Elusimicrobiota bacterium]|jgi:prepilin-type N-terminal cleavage/methylation domain-containing protein|nr:prepilin-type N-terminal cleavage/methylation domain-containing protein [Elusimicrobiota bacterium]